MSTSPFSSLRLVWLYPDLLSTYGDRGNLQVLAFRAMSRGIDVDIVEVTSDKHMPTEGDIYLIGGGEDGPQALACERLIADGGLARAVNRGAVIFSVCAGYQLMGSSFMAKGQQYAGLGLMDIQSQRGETRAVGELAGEVDPRLGLPTLTGFENHGGRTFVGPSAAPLVRVTAGVGNDGQTEGAWANRIIGTYLHGPALARNPALADLLLAWATGRQLGALEDRWPEALRGERLAAVLGGGGKGLGRGDVRGDMRGDMQSAMEMI
ncbi:glutamine amidotransferase [Actinorhabdospora filicis]|uniref:Lipid II isoglutaminyl synthase (glutamine-hydrolyzing) subunit GatD n=1 Tax=Actinorhabdospora filicis TaxID=1785913 RepID=A0A9W6SH84_9ACTN|nr:glutamine amidotransferase [Actinorhabdospora filicis]GLZ75384.1 glutamine amidotransferase [Actinorhabdospora filicis]